MANGASTSPLLAASLLALVAQAGALHLFGQPLICACGYVKLWEGVVRSSGNSQHLSDWYSLSHLVHGFLFYAILWKLAPQLPLSQRFAAAVALEAGWEIVENTPFVIHLYRRQALAQGYVGDSIVNSLSDTGMMAAGFALASRLPVPAVVALGSALEIVPGLVIRDNLTLNVLNFIHPFAAVSRWQNGA
jgi:hypothetical protein